MTYRFLDIIKSSDNHNKWEEVTSLLTSYSKDPNDIVNSISQSLLHLNNYSAKFRKQICRNDKEKSIKYIKLICKLKNLLFSETSRNGVNCLELSCDCFRIIIVLNDNRTMQNDSNISIFKQILFEYNKEKPISCPELLKSMSDGCYDQLLTHIYELQTLYSVGHDKQEQLKAFLCLQSLEEDINKLSKCPINVNNVGPEFMPLIPLPNNLIGIVKTRSGGIPAQFVFYCPFGVKNDCDSSTDRFKITLQLMDHQEKNLLPFIPLVNLQKDINGNCVPSFVTADALKCVSLAAKFVLRLSQPLIMSEANIAAIFFITGLDVITTGMPMNYVDLILAHNGSSLIHKDQFFAILPNLVQLVFQITDDEMSFNAQTVTCIPFLLPSQLPRIIAILKKQAIINNLMGSFLLADQKTTFIKDMHNAQSIHVSIAHDYFLLSYSRSHSNGKLVKFSLTFNDFSQISVNFLSSSNIMHDGQTLLKFQKIVHKYNNLPMIIFWLLYKSGDMFLMESLTESQSSSKRINESTDYCSTLMSNSNRFIEDNQFVNNCIVAAKTNLTINSVYHNDIFPKIKIEPKLEYMTTATTTSHQIVNSFSTIVHDSLSTIAKAKPTVSHTHEPPNPSIVPSNCQPDVNNSNPMAVVSSSIISSSNSVMVPPVQLHKSEPIVPYSTYGSKHLSLDQMLSSDFAMPFTSDALGSLNTLSHSMHYSDHSSHVAAISAANNNYPNHFNLGPHQKDTNPKIGRLYDTQSSVLVNLLNCNENSGSGNSGGFVNRQLSRNITNPSQMSDQFESPLMHPHLSRIPHIPRLRMPHPNPSKSATVVSSRPPLSSVTVSPPPPPKPDVLMMPYPQDTGDGRALMVRKPRKKKLSSLEMNQRLPKQPMMQPPTLRQPIHHDAMHSSLSTTVHPIQHSSNNVQPHQQSSISSSNFSSPTTMDQSIYDFDDNTDCGRSRMIPSTGNIQSQQMNFNNPANRKLANTASKKPLKVKISRKTIAQNPNSQEFKQSFIPDQDMKMKEKLSKSNSNITVFNPNIHNTMRSTAIMNAIDSPLTCSSLSSMQTSPHGSVSVSCSQMSIDSISDPNLLKKRRKRRLKSELEDPPESLKKKEKLEMRKQNRKKKELLLNNGNSQSGISSNSSLETVPSTDLSIKAPLPIKLSLNAKTGSVSNSNSIANMANSNRSNKVTLPLACQPSNSSIWMNQNTNALLKQSMKQSESKHQPSSATAEPLLKNYKIPKKKSSETQMPLAFQDSVKTELHSHSANFSKSHSSITPNDVSKHTKDGLEFMKTEPEISTSSNPVVMERPKTPIMLHPDAAVSLSSSQLSSIPTCVPDQDIKHNPDISSNPTTAPLKVKNIHDIVDKLRARSGSASAANHETITVSTSAISEFPPTKSSVAPNIVDNGGGGCGGNNPNQQNSSENIFEKFSSSKNNGKSDHRQFTNSRFPESSCMNIQRYPYNRPPAGFPAPKLRPPVGAPIPYGVPRQPYLNNPNAYRMDSAPVRNFVPVHPGNIPYGPKKNPNNAFSTKKK